MKDFKVNNFHHLNLAIKHLENILSHYKDTDIAIIGMSCRYPGNVTSPQEFWQFILDGKDGIVDVPENRWNKKAFYNEDKTKPGKMYVNQGGFINNVDQFDPQFFNISPKEAPHIDPQHRWLLELSQEVFENAGIKASELKGSDTAVYMGQFMHDYEQLQLDSSAKSQLSSHSATGPSMTLTSNRISYSYDLTGPSVTLDTACSSSLVALDLACKSVLNGDSAMALAGGVNILLRPELTMSICKASMLSPDARCKSFDASANGYVRSEGAGVVLIKKLSEAQKDGDNILAVIKATGINQDGQTIGITVPNGGSQQKLLNKTLKQAGFKYSDIQYAEAHGTGTAVGDPIEVNALGATLGDRDQAVDKCVIGSVKSNLGHTEAAAGVAGLIKTVMALQAETIPGNIHLNNVNPAIDEKGLNIELAHRQKPWTVASGITRKAVVNSFGFGGTNSNVVLEQAPVSLALNANQSPTVNHNYHALVISAKSKQALSDQAKAYQKFLKSTDASLHDICYSAAKKRDHYPHRAIINSCDIDSMIVELQRFIDGNSSIAINSAKVNSASNDEICFVFSGMGTTWAELGKKLYLQEPVFKQMLEGCDQALAKLSGWSLLEVMFNQNDDELIHSTEYAQPAIFASQVALAELLKSWGIKPAAVVGHSAGEVAAAYVAGALDFNDAIKVVYHRSQLQHSTEGMGKMLAVGITEDQLPTYLTGLEDKVSVAAINSQDAITLSGDADALESIALALDEQGLFARFLNVAVPYHSPVMDQLKQPLIDALEGITVHGTHTPLYSTVSGDLSGEGDWGKEYWPENVREPVYFKQAIEAILDDGYNCFVEIAPHAALSSSIKKNCAEVVGAVVIPTMIRQQDDSLMLANTLANLHNAGINLDWDLLYPNSGNFVALPNYAWQRSAYWFENEDVANARLNNITSSGGFSQPVHPLMGGELNSTQLVWQNNIDLQTESWLKDHQVENEVVYPGAAYAEMGLFVSHQINQQLCIEDIHFNRALFLNEQKPTAIETQVDGNCYQINSFDESSKQWQAVSKGVMIAAVKHATKSHINLDVYKSLAQQFDKTEFYQHCGQLGLNYQHHFQGVKQAWFDSQSCLVEIDLQQFASFDGYHLHPAILDSAFQSLFPTIDSGFLPVKIDQLNVFKAVTGQCFALLTTKIKTDQDIKGDIVICDCHGAVLVEVMGVELKATNANKKSTQVLYKADWQALELSLNEENKHWLIVQDRLGIALNLTQTLKNNEQRFTTLDINHNDFNEQLSKAINKHTNAKLVYLGAADSDCHDDLNGQHLFDQSKLSTTIPMKMAQQLEQDEFEGAVYLVTTKAKNPKNTVPVQSALWGFGRVWASEQPAIDISMIDYQVDDIERLYLALNANEYEQELIVAESFLANRIKAIEPADLNANSQVQLQQGGAADFSIDLSTKELIKARSDNEHQADFFAISSLDNQLAVIANENGLDVQFNVAPSSFKCKLNLRKDISAQLQTAAILDYTAALYLIEQLSHINAGDTLLLHKADDLFAQAIIEIAQANGIHVIATVTDLSLEKQSNVEYYQGDSLNFIEKIRINYPKGIDLVINRLGFDYAFKSQMLLAPFGEFIDLNAEANVGIDNNQRYVKFQISELFKLRPELFWQVAEKALALIPSDLVISRSVLSEISTTEANLYLRNETSLSVKQGIMAETVSNNGSYIVTGGLGGLGLELMDWLSSKGAGAIILLGRSKPSADAQAKIDQVNVMGGNVVALQADVSDFSSLKEVFFHAQQTLPVIKGIIHAAGVLDDGAISTQTQQRFEKVLAPKLLGSWNLHQLSLDLPIEMFVCFSSIAAIVGWSGQSNYAAANAFMDGLAHYRQQKGLAANSINWGPWAEVGMAASLEDREVKAMNDAGMYAIDIELGMQSMDTLMQYQQTNAGVFELDWSKIVAQYVNPEKKTQFANLVDHQSDENQTNFIDEFKLADDKQQMKLLLQKASEIMAQVLGLEDSDALDKNRSVFDYGLNSLMGMDFNNRLQVTLNAKLPATLVMKYPTIQAMCEFILADVLDKDLLEETQNLALWDSKTPDIYNYKQLSGELGFTTAVANMLVQGQSTHFNLAGMMELSEADYDEFAFRKTINILLRHHDGARIQVYQKNDQWQQCIATLNEEYQIESHDYSELEYEFGVKQIEANNERLQRDFKFELGNPLYRMAHYKLDDEKPHRFLLIFHHFIADGMSLNLFQKNFDEVYSKVKQQQVVELSKPEVNLIEWTQRLAEFSKKEAVQQIDYWQQKVSESKIAYLASDKDEPRLAEHLVSKDVFIEAELTQELEKLALHLNIDFADIGTAAINQGLSEISLSNALWTDTVLHGRSGIFDDIQLPNVFAQVAEYASILFTMDNCLSTNEQLQQIHQQRIDLPNNGTGMKVLQYLHDQTLFCDYDIPQVLINFDLTDYDSMKNNFAKESVGSSETLIIEKQHSYDFHFKIVRKDKGILIKTSYWKNNRECKTVEQVCQQIKHYLTNLVVKEKTLIQA